MVFIVGGSNDAISGSIKSRMAASRHLGSTAFLFHFWCTRQLRIAASEEVNIFFFILNVSLNLCSHRIVIDAALNTRYMQPRCNRDGMSEE